MTITTAEAEAIELASFDAAPIPADVWYDLHAFPCPWMGGPYTPEET